MSNSNNKVRNVIVGAAVGIGCGAILIKKYMSKLDSNGDIKENSKKVVSDTKELGKSVGEAAKKVYFTITNKVNEVSDEIKEKLNEKKEDILKEDVSDNNYNNNSEDDLDDDLDDDL